MFSGLNNLRDITLSPAYSAICGYTEADLDTVFAPEPPGLDRDEIRAWYDGYDWLGPDNVYNPYDVLPMPTSTPCARRSTPCSRAFRTSGHTRNPIYESWGFPEVWIEVPDAVWRRRPKNRPPGLTIHLLEGGRYREAAASRSFPTWTAEETHRALNESAVSSGTVQVLRRVADALAAREGTGPDDDPLLRRERAEGRERGRLEGWEEGRTEGRADERLDILRNAVRDAFAARCLAVTPDLRRWLDEVDPALDAVALIRLAWECRDADDFLRRAP